MVSANKQAHILVVEDSIANQRVACSILEHAGYFADVVANGQVALDALTSTPYDLVLMDCSMPVMDGFTATRRIRAMDSKVLNRNIPIVALTALAMKDDAAGPGTLAAVMGGAQCDRT